MHANVAAARRPWLSDVEVRLREQFREKAPSLEELARAAGVHPVHLARSFRARTGSTVGEFVRRLRINWAMAQLLATDMPLAELSVEAGFSDQSHFTRLFRATLGETPARYRRRHGR
jgi:AraC family transcriptional regulator